MKQLRLYGVILWGAVILTSAPVYHTDGVNALPDSGLGAIVYATPGSTWDVHFEDLVNQGDADFNDMWLTFSFDPEVIPGWLTGTAVYRAGISSHVGAAQIIGNPNPLSMFGRSTSLFMRTGSEVQIYFTDMATGAIWQTGPAERNWDGYAHAIVHGLPATSGAIPEPGTWVLLSTGAGLILIGRKYHRL